MFLDHTQQRTTVGRTPLDEWLARRRDLYLTTHDTHNRQISMPPVGFEPKISAGERPAAAPLLRSCMFIAVLYMLRVAMCPSSGELYQYDIWYMSLCIDDCLVCRFGWACSAVSSKPAHQTVIYTEWHIADVVLIQLILLMMGTWLPETCRE